jgi:hypothetical protein
MFFSTPAIRFMAGNENDAAEQRIFAETLFSIATRLALAPSPEHTILPKGSAKTL